MSFRLAQLMAARWVAAWDRLSSRADRITPDRIAELTTTLSSGRQTLDEFTAAMEQEFLDLGVTLGSVSQLAREVQTGALAVTDALAGHADDAGIQFAFQLLQKADALVHDSREHYERVFTVFGHMHTELSAIALERDSLMRTLSPLESTNTQFRIQACPFDDMTREQFFALADTIRAIVSDVQTAVGQRFEELENTARAAGDLVTNLRGFVADQEEKTESMLSNTRCHLSTLSEELSSSGAVAQSLSDVGQRVSTGVARAVIAMQCQDMARQKFQHISAAMSEMSDHLSTASAGTIKSSEAADCRRFLVHASRLQLSQLDAVFNQLDGAAQDIAGGLGDVKAAARQFAEQAVQSGSTTRDGQLIVHAIKSLHSVLGVMDNAVSSVDNVLELVDRLKCTFSDCTLQILGLAFNLRLVALNAQVFASHVEAGAALEVVARNTGTIAEESMQQLDGISARVATLVESVVDLERRLREYREVAVLERSHLSADASESEARLIDLSHALETRIAAIAPVERKLSSVVDIANRSIRFPEAVAEARTASAQVFEQILSLYAALEEHGSQSHDKVEELRRNYTMAHERVVHDAATQTGAVTHTETARADELADNIELF